MTPLLSILIPTVDGREACYDSLVSELNRQIEDIFPFDLVEIVTHKDAKQISISQKREELYKMANGLYSWQIDDDDTIAPDAISLILDEIPKNPDCITFEESVTIDGKYSRSNFSLKYKEWNGDGNRVLDDGFHYQRSPFYKCVIKTDIARSVPFPTNCRYNEDEQWSMALIHHLSTEVHIDKQIYIYKYESTPFNERYGIK